jgi:hypothetical protein
MTFFFLFKGLTLWIHKYVVNLKISVFPWKGYSTDPNYERLLSVSGQAIGHLGHFLWKQ